MFLVFFLQNFIRDPYTTTMGSFSKVTNFLRDVLMSDNPQARPREDVAELLQDDTPIPGMEVNHQDEPGFEMVTKVSLIMPLLAAAQMVLSVYQF